MKTRGTEIDRELYNSVGWDTHRLLGCLLLDSHLLHLFSEDSDLEKDMDKELVIRPQDCAKD